MFQEQSVAPTNYAELFKSFFPLISLLLNLVVTGYFFYFKNKKENKELEKKIAREDAEIERKTKMDWFKTLILDSNLKYFHEFFEKVEEEMKILLAEGIDEAVKTKVNETIKDYHKKFRVRFIDSLLAVDDDIYDNLIKISDELIDSFTNSIFDPGINLSHLPKFEEIVIKQISETKTQMIQELFKFKGLSPNRETALLPAN